MAAGAIHFLSLRKDVNLVVVGGSTFAALGWRLGRLAVTIGTLVWAATQGAPRSWQQQAGSCSRGT
jgi:hypothetical protein